MGVLQPILLAHRGDLAWHPLRVKLLLLTTPYYYSVLQSVARHCTRARAHASRFLCICRTEVGCTCCTFCHIL